MAWIASAVAARPAGEQLRLVAGEREQAAAVRRRRVAGRSLSVTAKRPVGVSVPGRPIATGNERTARLPRRSVSRRAERSTCIDQSVAPSRTRRPGSSPACRWAARSPARAASRARRAITESTRGESNSVRRPIQCSGRPPGVARSCVGAEHPRGQVAAGAGGRLGGGRARRRWTGRERGRPQASMPRRIRRASPRRAGEPRASPEPRLPRGREQRRAACAARRRARCARAARRRARGSRRRGRAGGRGSSAPSRPTPRRRSTADRRSRTPCRGSAPSARRRPRASGRVRMSAMFSTHAEPLEVGVVVLARLLDHLERPLDALQREVLRLGGDQRPVGGDERR